MWRSDMYLVTMSSQIVIGVWWFFILIIVSSYTGTSLIRELIRIRNELPQMTTDADTRFQGIKMWHARDIILGFFFKPYELEYVPRSIWKNSYSLNLKKQTWPRFWLWLKWKSQFNHFKIYHSKRICFMVPLKKLRFMIIWN